MRQAGGDSVEKEEDEEAGMPHAILDVVAEDPEEEHVAGEMQERAM